MSGPAIRTAIIGCGVIGHHHARVLSAHPRFEVTALVDIRPAAADEVAELVSTGDGAPRPYVTTTLDEVLVRGGVDLVVVCTQSGTHIDIATEAVTAGLHTVVEKPLDVDIAKVTIPVAAGRNLAVLVEAAVRNRVLQLRGIDSTHDFIARQSQHLREDER